MEKEKEALKDILWEMALLIRDLLENDCENSGKNWMDYFEEKIEKV